MKNNQRVGYTSCFQDDACLNSWGMQVQKMMIFAGGNR